jgi:activator of 2-hydroxyglutaryl-CoA dehydratase
VTVPSATALRFGDAGSSWCKTFAAGDAVVRIVPSREVKRRGLAFAFGTGHSARALSARFENDLIALSRGALALIDDADFTVLDLGSRDAKLVAFAERRPLRLDWSVGCAAATGATLEMLGKFYAVDFAAVPIDERFAHVTCGTYAVERIMDAVAAGESAEEAIGRFVHGLARSSFDFAGRPARLHLSGGFTRCPPYLAALARYTEVVPLGRTVPLAGLWAFAADDDPSLGPVPDALRSSRCVFDEG